MHELRQSECGHIARIAEERLVLDRATKFLPEKTKRTVVHLDHLVRILRNELLVWPRHPATSLFGSCPKVITCSCGASSRSVNGAKDGINSGRYVRRRDPRGKCSGSLDPLARVSTHEIGATKGGSL